MSGLLHKPDLFAPLFSIPSCRYYSSKWPRESESSQIVAERALIVLHQALFSSDLIEFNSGVEQKGFAVRSEIWIFVIIAVALTALTMLGIWVLERRQRQRLFATSR